MPDSIIITGASRGVGLAIAQHLANEGYRIIAIARSEGQELPAARAALTGPGEIIFRAFDLADVEGIGEFVRALRAEFGAPYALTKYVARAMMATGRGRIVNISSIIGSTGYSGLSVYGATKASLLGFTRSLAREVGRLGVTVNAVAPGFMDTEMTKSLGDDQRDQVARRSALRRLVTPQDVASSVAYLLSDAGRNVTGTVLTIDAGNTA